MVVSHDAEQSSISAGIKIWRKQSRVKTRENQTLITNIFGTGLSFSGLAAEVNLVELLLLCKGWREAAVCLDIHPEILHH